MAQLPLRHVQPEHLVGAVPLVPSGGPGSRRSATPRRRHPQCPHAAPDGARGDGRVVVSRAPWLLQVLPRQVLQDRPRRPCRRLAMHHQARGLQWTRGGDWRPWRRGGGGAPHGETQVSTIQPCQQAAPLGTLVVCHQISALFVRDLDFDFTWQNIRRGTIFWDIFVVGTTKLAIEEVATVREAIFYGSV